MNIHEKRDLFFLFPHENQRLLEKIAENGNDPDRRGTRNVLLIGMPGSGKSALISSIYTSVTGSYRQIVQSGSGDAQTVTLSLKHVKKCGIRDQDIMDHPNATLLREVVDSAPNIFDFAGLGNINTPALKEVLRMTIQGYIPPGTHYRQIEEFHQRYGVGTLKVRFGNRKKEWKVTAIVFVQSCQETVPGNLIDCLNEVLKEVDPWTFKQTYRGSVFIVITKKDLAPKETIISSIMKWLSSQDENDNEVEKDLSRKFNFGNNLKYNRLWVTNYSEATGYDYTPEIANMHLQLLYHLTLRGANDDDDDDDDDDDMSVWLTMKYLYLEVKRLVDILCELFREQQIPNSYALVIAIAVFLFAYYYHTDRSKT